MHLPARLTTILLAIAVVAVSFFVSLRAIEWIAPRPSTSPPVLAALPPLVAAPRSSIVVVPVAIALSAIREAAERAAPRNFAGKSDNPVSQVLQNADIGWTALRGPILASGARDVLSLSTPLTGRSARSTSSSSTPAPQSRATSPSPRDRSLPRPGISNRTFPPPSIWATPRSRSPARR